MTLPPERAAELAKSPKANKWKMIKAKVEFIINLSFGNGCLCSHCNFFSN